MNRNVFAASRNWSTAAAAVLGLGLTLASAPAWSEVWLDQVVAVAPIGPSYLTLGKDGNLYGASEYGTGVYGTPGGMGFLFELIAPSSPGGNYTYQLLHTMADQDGWFVTSALVPGKDGNFYGTLLESPNNTLGGMVFQLVPPATPGGAFAYNAVVNFAGSGLADPYDLFLGNDGDFYGYAAGANGLDHLFQVVPPTTPGGAFTLNSLYQFSAGPIFSLIQGKDGDFYGTTFGESGGSIFQLVPPSTPGGSYTYNSLYTYDFGKGPRPEANEPYLSFQGSDGAFYGVGLDDYDDLYTATGQYVGYSTGYTGRVFKLSPPATPGGAYTFTTLHFFDADIAGGTPNSLLQAPDGNIYGTAVNGGLDEQGLAFQLVPPATPGGQYTYNIISDFFGSVLAATPTAPSAVANLTLGSDGALYGTAGANDQSGDGSEYNVYGVAVRIAPATTPQQAPVWVSPPTPADQTTYAGLIATEPFSLPAQLEASTSQTGDMVSINFNPQIALGGTLNTQQGNPSKASFQWAPPYAGNYAITFTATDPLNSLSATRTFNFVVSKRNTGLAVTPAIIDLRTIKPGKVVTLKLSATLYALNPSQPLAERAVRFTAPNGDIICEGTSDYTGVATCSQAYSLAWLRAVAALGYTVIYTPADQYDDTRTYNGTAARGTYVLLP
jgi:hypothetical protein